MFLDRVIALDLVLHLEEFCEPFFGLLESSYLLLRRFVLLVLVLDEFHNHVFLEQDHHNDRDDGSHSAAEERQQRSDLGAHVVGVEVADHPLSVA